MAGLPHKSACVKVGPPLSCSGPSFSSAPVRLNWSSGPGKIRTFVLPIKLKPPETTVSDSSVNRSKLAVLPATIVFFSSSDPWLLKTAQFEDPAAALLAVTVLWVNVVVPQVLNNPPLAGVPAPGVPAPGTAELPLTVLFSRVTVPQLLAMPPPSHVPPAPVLPAPPVTPFPLTVHLSKFSVPKSLAIPPPRAAPPP